MKKRMFLLLLIAALLAMAGCRKKPAETTPTQMQVPETTKATEVTIPGLEDSIFIDETLPAEAETKPEETLPEKDPESEQQEGSHEDNSVTPKPTEAPEKETTAPTDPTQATVPDVSDYEAFQNLAPADQQKYVESFESIDAFFNWYNSEKEKYEQANPPIDVGDGVIDMDQFAGGSN